MRAGVGFLAVLVFSTTVWAGPSEKEIREAVSRALPVLAAGASRYTEKRTCFSCHHQAMAMFALSAARQKRFSVDEAVLKRQTEFTLDSFRSRRDRIAKGEGVPGGNTTTVYALAALRSAGYECDESCDALVDYLLKRQRPDGSWPATTQRPPTEGSAFTNAALALETLRHYGLVADGNPERQQRIRQAIERGRDWLVKNRPTTTEDRVFHLRGLAESGAAPEAVAAAREQLIGMQHEDGSWAQLPDRPGDAYATGTVLVSLRRAGVPMDHAAVLKGVAYLLRTQRSDGYWLVETRSRPVQVFFDNGDPGGKSQFITFAATGWAVLALLEACP